MHPSQVCVDSQRAARVARPAVCPCTVLCSTVPLVGCSKRLDCRIRSTPPPLMPEKATSSKVRPAALGRPPRSSACTARTPNVQLRLRTRAPCLFPLVTGPSLRALVSRNRWFLLRPVVSPLVLASSGGFAAGSSLVRRLRRWFLLHPAASPLVLGWSGGFAVGLASPAGLRWSCACSHPSVFRRLRRGSLVLVSAAHFLSATARSLCA